MTSRFFKRAQTVLSHVARDTTCLHRGETKRLEKWKCCGQVEMFDCAKLGWEVGHTKCRSCGEHKPDPAKQVGTNIG